MEAFDRLIDGATDSIGSILTAWSVNSLSARSFSGGYWFSSHLVVRSTLSWAPPALSEVSFSRSTRLSCLRR